MFLLVHWWQKRTLIYVIILLFIIWWMKLSLQCLAYCPLFVKKKIVGLAKVLQVFRSSKYGSVAGCIVEEGSVKRKLPIRVLRDGFVIFEGELESLRRHKDESEEVRSGTECGIGVRNYNDIKVGDEIECYEKIMVERTL